MKVVGINGSSRKDGNTAIIIGKVFDELNKEGIETELIQLADYEIQPCRGCFACEGRGNCVFAKDGFAEIFSRMVKAVGIILGSPVYSVYSAKMKAFLERAGVVVATNPGLLRHKIGAAVAAVRRGGGMTTVDTMNHFMLNKEMIVVGSTYWNMVYGKNIGDMLGDDEGMANMHNLGENMASLIKRLKDSTMNKNKIYPRSNDNQTVYLKSVVSCPTIEVGDFTINNDFVNDTIRNGEIELLKNI